MAAALDILSRSEILTDERPPDLRPPADPRRRLRRPARRRAGAAPRAGRAGPAASRAPPPSRSPPTCCGHHAGAVPPPWSCCAPPPARRSRAARRTRPSGSCGGRWRSRCPDPSAPRVLVELGRVETLVDGPAGVAHLSEAYAALDDAARARPARDGHRPHPRLRLPSRRGDRRSRARRRPPFPTGLDDERQGLVALQRITGFMHGLPADSYRAGPVPEVSGEGDGARMLAATLSLRAAARRRGPRPGGRAGSLRPGRRPAARRGQRAALDRRRQRAAAGRRRPRRLLGPGPGPRARDGRTVRRPVGEPVARLHPVASRPARRRAAVAGRRRPSSSGCGASPASPRRTPPPSRSAC